MQTVVQVISGKTKSLRDTIVNDKRLEDFGLEVAEHKRQTRPHGWAKIHMPGELGAINIQWHGASRTLIEIASKSATPARALSRKYFGGLSASRRPSFAALSEKRTLLVDCLLRCSALQFGNR